MARTRHLHVLGSGGHAKVAIATARAAGWNVAALYDDREDRRGQRLLGVPIAGGTDDLPLDAPAIIAIGDNRVRQRLATELGATWATVIHPTALVHESVAIAAGTVIFAGAILQPDTTIGPHAIVNTGARIDHDCRIEAFAHIAPGVSLCGGVRVGKGALVGVGASAIPGTAVGSWAVVGGGACVTSYIPDNATALGVPAKVRSS